MREEAWQGSPHVEAGLASVPDATRVPVTVAVPCPRHPAPWPPSQGLRDPGGRKDSPVSLHEECGVPGVWVSKEHPCGRKCACVCVLQTATKTERVNIEIKETLP